MTSQVIEKAVINEPEPGINILESIPEKVSVQEIEKLAYENELKSIDINHNTNNKNEEEILYAYTFEYRKSNASNNKPISNENDENNIEETSNKFKIKDRFKRTSKKVMRFKQDFDIKKTYEKFRDDILLTVQ